MEPNGKGKTSGCIIIPVKSVDEEEYRHDADVVEKDQKTPEEMEKRWRRALADYDNYRKRCQREMAKIREEEQVAIFSSWLPIVESIEKALETCEEKAHPIVKGVKIMHKQIKQLFSSYGIVEVPTENMIFDPALHEVVGTVAHPQCPEGFIVKVVQKGYQMRKRLIRAAKVLVVKNYDTNNEK